MKLSIRHGYLAIGIFTALVIGYWVVIWMPQKQRLQIESEVELAKIQVEKDKVQAEKDKQDIYSDCKTTARDKARKLLEKNYEIDGYSSQKKMLDQGLVLKKDYEYGYNDCLRSHGLDPIELELNL